MMYRTFADLGVYPPATVVKVDDTIPGIAEGRAAGTWTVGLSVSGNMIGMNEAEWEATSAERQAALRTAATEKLHAAGADYVIDSVATLLPVLDSIDRRLAGGEIPTARGA
jgi:phosphonoacetaldehyde hydrolase